VYILDYSTHVQGIQKLSKTETGRELQCEALGRRIDASTTSMRTMRRNSVARSSEARERSALADHVCRLHYEDNCGEVAEMRTLSYPLAFKAGMTEPRWRAAML